MSHIDYYFSVLSPFAYLAGDRMETIAAAHGATITYKPIDIGALFPRSGGVPLPQRPEARRAYRLKDLQRQSARLAMPLTLQPAHFPTNAAPASYAIIAAQAAGGGDTGALVRAVLRACWAEDKDIADDQVIRACLIQAGFDAGVADKGLLLGAETYARNLEDAVAAGVFGSPFYVVDGAEPFWGQDRLNDLDDHLRGAS
ncbi:2-hydroxychromene-2-carboxylate isomerase [Actibacterium sp. XHP0104]|uniref:2-hydroxychromene-2-carboxylate isomerase n=1 Tax=Actibacterium sp. XHP0104 TaxID=2984335 RepID=UPI0021E81E55|nr:2-hydroxychromene-2-carboxylate isomerase [Actibacterium sp. XHP0104]MCV2882266.1 2-hydroxychromene-2-carboxylate isomerase [Actibacterium sp. XHP0104]